MGTGLRFRPFYLSLIHYICNSMAKATVFNKLISKVGLSMSMLCAFHCVATPFTVAIFPSMTAGMMSNPFVEFSLLGLSLVLIGRKLLKDFALHKNILPLIITMFGYSAVVASHFMEQEFGHLIPVIVGTFLILAGYIVNWFVLREYSTCQLK